MRKLFISERAKEDLIEVWLYTAENWSDAQADRYLDHLEEGIHQCCEAPERGKNREAVRPGYYSVLVRKHVVFYTFTDEQVVVRRVLHGTMDPALHME